MIIKILISMLFIHLGVANNDTYLEKVDCLHKPPNEMSLTAIIDEPYVLYCPPHEILRINRVHKCVTLRGAHDLVSMQGSNY